MTTQKEQPQQPPVSNGPKHCSHPETKRVNGKTHCARCGAQLYL